MEKIVEVFVDVPCERIVEKIVEVPCVIVDPANDLGIPFNCQN